MSPVNVLPSGLTCSLSHIMSVGHFEDIWQLCMVTIMKIKFNTFKLLDLYVPGIAEYDEDYIFSSFIC